MLDAIRKEELSRCYLNAICAYKGIAVERPRLDYDSVDAILRATISRNGERVGAEINVQLKATSQRLKEDNIGFDFILPVKNYNDLRMKSAAPRMLCVLRLPLNEGEWVTHSINELILKNCMYWFDLTKLPNSDNTTSVTLHIPWANTLTPETVLELLRRSVDGTL